MFWPGPHVQAVEYSQLSNLVKRGRSAWLVLEMYYRTEQLSIKKVLCKSRAQSVPQYCYQVNTNP